MPVAINFNICDNAKECGGIESCPFQAIYWDEKEKKIKIDNTKCTGCKICIKECPVGAIKASKSQQEFKQIQQEIKNDKRKRSDLFVDRYGAQPIKLAFQIKQDQFEKRVINSQHPIIVELFNDDSIECLLKSIPIRDIIQTTEYLKVHLTDEELLNKLNIKKLPALVYYKDKKMLGKIEGYLEKSKKDELKEKINQILNNN